jgi:isoleucyl-tRNA synthetase
MWVSCSDFTQDLKLGANILKQLEDVYKKLRNTIKYMLGALSGYNASVESVPYADLPDLEKWVLHRLTEIHRELTVCTDSYDINKYFMTLYTFCSSDLSSFFFDIRKDCLYCDHEDDPKRRAYRCVLNALYQYIIRWSAPIIVFTAEEAWLCSHNTSSVHLENFLVPDDAWINKKLCDTIDKVKEIRRSVTTALENFRKNKIIGSGLQANVTVFDPDNIVPIKDELFWEEVAITSGFKIRNESIPQEAFVSDDLRNIGVIVSVANGEKCERCWKVFAFLNEDKICERCQKVLARKS